MNNMRTVGVLALVAAVAATLVIVLRAPVAQDAMTEKQMMIDKGRQYDSAWALYQALESEADGGQRLEWSNLPDWSGVYVRTGRDTKFDMDQPEDGLPTAVLTPEYEAELLNRLDEIERGIEFDPISNCTIVPGHPRWLTMPFLREHIVTPHQTTMIAEAFSSVRRIYTDGRDHMPEGEQYPLHTGDSIGFWDGDKLVIHTNQLMAHYYERHQPQYTDQVETVEIWQKVEDDALEADVWVYDPPVLAEPWYAKQHYTKVDNPDRTIRISYYSCHGNPNSEVYMTEEGGSNFVDLQFTDMDDVD